IRGCAPPAPTRADRPTPANPRRADGPREVRARHWRRRGPIGLAHAFPSGARSALLALTPTVRFPVLLTPTAQLLPAGGPPARRAPQARLPATAGRPAGPPREVSGAGTRRR